ncbi:dihydrolipoamide acetyltransferase component of pyruvate dehydrogenase complex [Flexivirga endophytica]|uniref:Dihydrolipoamide acetyltransferase component of pyruvate dehydrogenase complex n=1 Tax=Flexivirga endophytica TaxID=1849103 RepID=A0A916T458_9MICO|nr:dihydrolipoamide acetyltransferase family protein [Flexivirga endophytica]GGB30531.1 dihydrolipoamide acetyltransferase component of pyruvate dehydrogenase complex [Flexivirga endophytica]GHB51435.1 dihydrolipoamide acetyltransferase component of pyruvate dehydrogenase complex [Flexivirga endophytica]
MGVKQFKLPDPGEGLVEADIVTWKIKPGDQVKVNDIVVEIETAKSLVELPIPWEGKVVELLVAEGATVEVGAAIVSVDVVGAEDDAPTTAPAAAEPADSSDDSGERVANLVGYGAVEGATKRRARRAFEGDRGPGSQGDPLPAPDLHLHVATDAVPNAPVPREDAPAPTRSRSNNAAPVEGGRGGKALAKPPVRKFAKDNGIDLSLVQPTREDGVISRADVESYLAGGGAAPAPVAGAASYDGARETRIPVKGVRKMTAQAMVGSAFTAPHVTEFVTIDMTRTMELVERLKSDRDFRDLKVTPLLVLAKALCVAIKRNPEVNATWDEAAQEIVVKHYVNLGIAAATPRGLVVPNIKDADRMSMRELGEALGALVGTAREGRTQPADMSGGTLTITNVGVFGVDTGTPIINPGESAILAFGAVRKMPWVVTDEHGVDQIVPRQVTQLGLSFDHRLIDGDLGSRFLADIAALLEDPARALVWG